MNSGTSSIKAGHRLPAVFKQDLVRNPAQAEVTDTLAKMGLNTVCREARCPNRNQCYSAGTATFLIMGDVCTRNCSFCAISKGHPVLLDSDEPLRLAEAIRQLSIKYAVITSVTRDDLPDGGAGHFAKVITAIRKSLPGALVEVLTPDFNGSKTSLKIVLDARPDVFNHNLETVERLYPLVRPQAVYRRSLDLLGAAAAAGIPAKSGLMTGLGETMTEVKQAMSHLRQSGCSILTVGQYLAPSKAHLPVDRFWSEEEFREIKDHGERELDFAAVMSGPTVRSSYLAYQTFQKINNQKTGGMT
jgi:lipoic acid synthetase